MTWNFDMSSIPRGHYETRYRTVRGEKQEYSEFVPDHIWVETRSGEVVKTFFLCDKRRGEGAWYELESEDDIICWQPYVRPVASGMGKRIEPERVDDVFRNACWTAEVTADNPGSVFMPTTKYDSGE